MKEKSRQTFLAVDLGASSGRVVAGHFDGRRLTLEEVHRFPNGGVRLPDGWHWELLGLFSAITEGLREAGRRYGGSLVSVGVDTWGVDYGLVDKHGRLLGLPYMYRDERTYRLPSRIERSISASRLYSITGIQRIHFNTLNQLYADRTADPVTLDRAARLLFVPDLLHYWLSGVMANEYTIASTSQMLDAKKRTWSREVIRAAGLPPHLFGALVEPGTRLGSLLPELRSSCGIKRLKVITPASHDTASAVVSVPARHANPAYLSSGTWSLLGTECGSPMLAKQAGRLQFTNEGGVQGTIRLLKNITGLWLIQECRRVWKERGQDLDFVKLADLARAAGPAVARINPDDPAFATPGDMPKRIQEDCRASGQKVPRSEGQIARVIYESLATRYREVLDNLSELTRAEYDRLYVVGGGAQNKFLNQQTADAIGKPVVAGPSEATAIGNIIVQMMSCGALASLDEARALVQDSFALDHYYPAVD